MNNMCTVVTVGGGGCKKLNRDKKLLMMYVTSTGISFVEPLLVAFQAQGHVVHGIAGLAVAAQLLAAVLQVEAGETFLFPCMLSRG